MPVVIILTSEDYSSIEKNHISAIMRSPRKIFSEKNSNPWIGQASLDAMVEFDRKSNLDLVRENKEFRWHSIVVDSRQIQLSPVRCWFEFKECFSRQSSLISDQVSNGKTKVSDQLCIHRSWSSRTVGCRHSSSCFVSTNESILIWLDRRKTNEENDRHLKILRHSFLRCKHADRN